LDDQVENLGLGLSAGDKHYRAYIGPPEDYDLVSAMTFGLLTTLGLRQHHHLLDIGCGSLRVGRLLIPYLNRGHYTGIEPNQWLVEEGITHEIGFDLVKIKQPTFHYTSSADQLDATQLFDFAVAQSIFSHCGQDLLIDWLEQASRLLAPSGALVATFLIGEKDPEQNGWIYPECVHYKVETMQTLATQKGLQFQILDWQHPRQTWALFAKPKFDSSWFRDRPLNWNTWFSNAPK
jgi:cyclopropane fatty-acyl-phospholipid synthase-like methyltransferase